MPEGDSLVRAAHRLRPVLEGRTLTAAQLRVPRHATAELAGWTVTAVIPRAKYLLMRLAPPDATLPADAPPDSAPPAGAPPDSAIAAGAPPAGADAPTPSATRAPRGLTLLSHLKMEGRWRVCTPDDRWPAPAHRVRAVLRTDDAQVLGVELGLLELLPTAEEESRLAHLGPDLLSPDWTDGMADEAVARLGADPARPIGAALLDQRLVAGLGNIYRCETLLLAGIDPHRPVGDVEDLSGLVALARDLMRATVPPAAPADGVPRRTTGVRPDPTAPFGVRVLVSERHPSSRPPGSVRVPGARPHGLARVPSYWVYGHDRQPCLRCGGPVTCEDLGAVAGQDRRLWWCRRCQR